MNKTEFGKKFSYLVRKYAARTYILGKDKKFIIESCSKVDRYQTLAKEEDIQVTVGYQKISNNRRVKMIFLKRKGTKFKVPVSKAKVLEALYPTKRRKKTSPEKMHRTKVIAAMRNMVAYQLKEYRSSLEYPLVCWRSQEVIRRGMKCDVDHIHKPFIQLAEEWLKEQKLTFCGLNLKGPVNNKIFVDPEKVDSWLSYHREHSRFALVLAKYNRSAGCGEYTPDAELVGSFKESKGLSLDF